MNLLHKGFTRGLKVIAGQFINGVWEGMGPRPKLSTKKTRKKRNIRIVNEYNPRGKR